MIEMSTFKHHAPEFNPSVVLVVELQSGMTLNLEMLRHEAWPIIDLIARPGSERFIKLGPDTVVAASEILMAQSVMKGTDG